MWKASAAILLMASRLSVLAQSVVSPAIQLREMNALYLSPYTVNAGHAQIESYLIGYAHTADKSAGVDTRTAIWSIASTTIKYGVLDNLDLELAVSPYTHVRTADYIVRSIERQRGFGDILLKAKLNLWGNDIGSTAMALLPSIKFPTAQDGLGNDAYEGGLAIPIALELPKEWWLFLSLEGAVVQKSSGSAYTGAFRNIATLWHQIVGDLSGYVEFVNGVAADIPDEWYGTVDLGSTYMLTGNVQLDVGLLLGVTRTAPDVNPFLGLSVRF